MLTPVNMAQNWAFARVEFSEYPVSIGNQYTSPAMMANTAPMEST